MRAIDVLHLGRPNVICCWEIDGAVIDPGPESSLDTLLEALGGEKPRAIVLTHIHLDHAAATGALVQRWPDLDVYVHERGAPHVIDPSKLLASAERLYGDRLEHLWGKILPVPEANVRVLGGGETVLGMRVAYTPGHASHHVSYLHEESGTAFTGDVAGVRIPGSSLVLPPSPPPDIDVELWHSSIALIEEWDPDRLAITHFGPIEDVPPHLAALHENLDLEAKLARELDAEAFEAQLKARLEESAESEAVRAEIAQANPPQYQYPGLRRYWDKREEREAAAQG